jgi:hypothetical protein
LDDDRELDVEVDEDDDREIDVEVDEDDDNASAGLANTPTTPSAATATSAPSRERRLRMTGSPSLVDTTAVTPSHGHSPTDPMVSGPTPPQRSRRLTPNAPPE